MGEVGVNWRQYLTIQLRDANIRSPSDTESRSYLKNADTVCNLHCFPISIVADGNFGRAAAEVNFPLDSLGSLYCAPPVRVYFGADAHVAGRVSEWEYFAAAAGKVRLPEGMLMRLSLKDSPKDSKSVQDTSWVSKAPFVTDKGKLSVAKPLDDHLEDVIRYLIEE